MSIAQQHAKIDSIVKAERKELLIIEQERLRDRMSIELKARVDSIVKNHEPVAPPPPVLAPVFDTIPLADTTNTPPPSI